MRRLIRGGVATILASVALLASTGVGVSHALWREEVPSPEVATTSHASQVGISLVRLDDSSDRDIAKQTTDVLKAQLTREDAQKVIDSEDGKLYIPLRVDVFATNPYGIDYQIAPPRWEGSPSVFSQSSLTLWRVVAQSDDEARKACEAGTNSPPASGPQQGELPPSGAAVHYWCLLVDHSNPSYQNTVTVTAASEFGQVQPASANWSAQVSSGFVDYYRNTVTANGEAVVGESSTPVTDSADWRAHLWAPGGLQLTHELTN